MPVLLRITHWTKSGLPVSPPGLFKRPDSYHSCPQERPQGELPRRPAQPRAQSSGSAGGILFEPAIIDDSVFQGHPKPLVREV